MLERAHEIYQARMNIGNYEKLIRLDPGCKLMVGGVLYHLLVPNGMQLLIGEPPILHEKSHLLELRNLWNTFVGLFVCLI